MKFIKQGSISQLENDVFRAKGVLFANDLPKVLWCELPEAGTDFTIEYDEETGKTTATEYIPKNEEDFIKIPSNEIWYTTIDNSLLYPNNVDEGGYVNYLEAYLYSNTYTDGKGVLSFDYLHKMDDSFYYSDGLFRSNKVNTVILPSSLDNIGTYAFDGCSNLTSVTIPNSVRFIEYRAFRDCTSLTTITIPNSVTIIGQESFYGCKGLTSIGPSGSGAALIISDSITSIEANAFDGCSGLTSITIPDSVTSIGSGAFADCSALTSITIPNNVTKINRWVFIRCTNLTSVTYNGTIEQWEAITKGTDWKKNVPSTCIVHCIDGDIPINEA